MRFQLDPEAARWFQHGLLRPVATVQLDPSFVDKLRESWSRDEGVLDLSKRLDDQKFLIQLIRRLVEVGHSENTYRKAFLTLAVSIEKALKLSIVDRLAALYNPPPAEDIQSERDQTRERAIKRLKEKRGIE